MKMKGCIVAANNGQRVERKVCVFVAFFVRVSFVFMRDSIIPLPF